MTVARSPVERFVGNASPLAFGQIGANALLLVNAVLLARILGVEGYGHVAIGMAMYGLTAFLSDAGLGMWGLRVIGDDPDRWATVVRLTAARSITASLALFLAFAAVLLLPLPEGARMPSIVMVVTMLPAGFSVEWALIGLEWTGRAAAARLLVAVGMVALSPILAMVAGPTGAAVGYVAAAGLGCGASWILLIASIGLPHWARPRGVLITIRRSLPMGASAVLGQIYWQSDSLLTGMLLGSAAAGLYAAPMRLLAAVIGFGWVLGTSVLPVYRALDAKGPAGVSTLATSITRLLLLAGIPAIGATVGGARTIVTTVLGPEFAQSAPVLAIGSMTVGLWLFMVPTGYAVLAKRHDIRYLAATAVAAIALLPTVWVLASARGIEGVAVAMLAAQTVGAIVIAVSASRVGVRLPPLLRTIALAGVVACVAAVGARSVPLGFVGVVAVALIAELPFAAALAVEIHKARRTGSPMGA